MRVSPKRNITCVLRKRKDTEMWTNTERKWSCENRVQIGGVTQLQAKERQGLTTRSKKRQGARRFFCGTSRSSAALLHVGFSPVRFVS